MITPQGDLPLHSPEDEVYGLGYQIVPLNETVQLVMHDGSNDGWRALFMALPDRGDGIVILTNSETGGHLAGPIVCNWAEWAAIDMSPLCP